MYDLLLLYSFQTVVPSNEINLNNNNNNNKGIEMIVINDLYKKGEDFVIEGEEDDEEQL